VLAFAGTLGLWATHAAANDELLKLQEDPKQWVMPLGNYASTRYSGLDQINRDNVGTLIEEARRAASQGSDEFVYRRIGQTVTEPA
jgi:glucose dehydrogenase